MTLPHDAPTATSDAASARRGPVPLWAMPQALSLQRQRGWRRREVVPALALGLAAAATAAILAVSDVVRTGDAHGWDAALILALRTPGDTANPVGPPWVEEAARDITGLGGIVVLVFVVLAAALFLVLSGRRASAAVMVAAGAGAASLGILVKGWFDRPRPELVPQLVEVYDASFPSGHATAAAAVYLTLGMLLARAQPEPRAKSWLVVAAILVAVAVGISRVYLGVHWPTDVLAGLALGAGWAAACWAFEFWLQQRGAAEVTEDR